MNTTFGHFLSNSYSLFIICMLLFEDMMLSDNVVPFAPQLPAPLPDSFGAIGWYFYSYCLAHQYRWMIEKFKGFRVYWDGSTIRTVKDKKVLQFPSSFTTQLPKIAFEADLRYRSGKL